MYTINVQKEQKSDKQQINDGDAPNTDERLSPRGVF
jgi:hypothetical protein